MRVGFHRTLKTVAVSCVRAICLHDVALLLGEVWSEEFLWGLVKLLTRAQVLVGGKGHDHARIHIACVCAYARTEGHARCIACCTYISTNIAFWCLVTALSFIANFPADPRGVASSAISPINHCVCDIIATNSKFNVFTSIQYVHGIATMCLIQSI